MLFRSNASFNFVSQSRYKNFLYSKDADEYDTIVFVHDDVYIDDLKLEKKLNEAFKVYDIVGLAGCVNPSITKPCLWHLMAGGFNSGNLRGAVAHYVDGSNVVRYVTSFGPTPARVTFLDGLFLAVNVKKVKSADWKFNENYKFHHYDISSSIDANRKKLKLGTWPINVIHCSPGLRSFNDSYNSSEEKFFAEYSS